MFFLVPISTTLFLLFNNSVFEPKQYLEVAQLLYNTDVSSQDKKHLSEAVHRASVSRAYYAAFLSADEKSSASGKGYGESHDTLIKAYIASADPKRKLIGNNLKTLKEYRKKSDYNLHACLTRKDCGTSLGLSEKIIKVLETIPS